MKAFTNINVSSVDEAVSAAAQAHNNGQSVAFSGGGTDLLQQLKDGTDKSDVIINLRNVEGAHEISSANGTIRIGGLITLDELSNSDLNDVLTEAAASVGTPQIRNVATLSGNVTQRPWCWYYRNSFNCYKAGGNECFSVTGENQQHAIYGGGPSYIVHPSDVAPALVALDASFIVAGPDGERNVSADNFFVMPSQDPATENSLRSDELLVGVSLPITSASSISHYYKIMDREAWTHAEVSVAAVLNMNGDLVESASIVLGGVATVPWKLTEVENYLVGRQLNTAVVSMAGQMAVIGARPLAKNGHKVSMTSAAVERTLLNLVNG
jgi:xanthine dehydrogenase YagS FAD-binding subunit